MDFDKPKVYGDTFISDGLVLIVMCMDFEIDIMQKFLGEVRGFSLFVLVSILPVGIFQEPIWTLRAPRMSLIS